MSLLILCKVLQTLSGQSRYLACLKSGFGYLGLPLKDRHCSQAQSLLHGHIVKGVRRTKSCSGMITSVNNPHQRAAKASMGTSYYAHLLDTSLMLESLQSSILLGLPSHRSCFHHVKLFSSLQHGRSTWNALCSIMWQCMQLESCLSLWLSAELGPECPLSFLGLSLG